MKRCMIVFAVFYLISQACSVSAVESNTVTDPATGMEFVLVKGGCYKMGNEGGRVDEKPIHDVCVKDFYIGKYEVTQAQWSKVMGNNPSSFHACGPSCPVESVSWNDALRFIESLSKKSKNQYRLPTEAEWEYAARGAGKTSAWAGVGDEARLGDFAWFENNSDNTIHKVGQKKANALGLYDMSGNVWEWCQDHYSDTYYTQSAKDNPTGPAEGTQRVTRGGAWGNDATSLRVSNRDNVEPETKNDNTGFRLVRVVK